MTEPPSSTSEPSPFVGQLHLPPSAVARPGGLLGPIAGGVGLALLGVYVFASLSAHRTHRPAAPAGPPGAAAPPMARMPAPPAASQFVFPAEGSRPQPLLMPGAYSAAAMPPGPPTPTPSAGPTDRLHAPAMVVDLGGAGGAAAVTASPAADGAQHGATAAQTQEKSELQGSPDEHFAVRLANAATASAAPTHLADNARIAPQGTIIPAVLETAINSDLPGYVRAVVSRDVHGYDGSTVLIPRGSRLIGQYRNAVAIGQSRAFVVWTRVLTPAGLSLDIQSPGTDRLGRSGLEGETHTHFFRRFGNAILLSILNAGLQAGANSVGNPSTAIVIGSQQQAASVATLALQKEIDIPDTVTVNQGAPIQVFVARDLDFTGVVGPRK